MPYPYLIVTLRSVRHNPSGRKLNEEMNICIIAGARPNFVKIAPIVRAVDRYNQQQSSNTVVCTVVYTGAADDGTLEPSLFDDLGMRQPDVYLGITSSDVHLITAGVTERIATYFDQNPTDVAIVVDDLASTMAAAIVAKKHDILLAHLVAGTRSFDIHVPKEINRLVIDGLSDILFTAGVSSNSTATREGVGQERIFMVGNIIIDSLRYSKTRQQCPQCFSQLGISDGGYLLLTLNRRMLLTEPSKLGQMLHSIVNAADSVPIIAPLRPTAVESVEKAIDEASNLFKDNTCFDHLKIVSPMSYLEFGYASSHAIGIITDSGNVAEEATFNGIPCATLNTYTEHIETVNIGTNRLVGDDAEAIGLAVGDMVTGKWPAGAIPDRWDGRTADRILQTLIGKTAAK